MYSGAEPFVQFGRGHQEEQICEIILYFDQWFRRRCLLKIFYLELCRPVCLAERMHLCNFERGHHGGGGGGGHSFEVI